MVCRRPVLVCLVLAGVLAGCGPSPRNLPKAKVKGTVSHKGQPLPAGTIVFQHSTGEMASGNLSSDGQYSLEVATGPNKVMVQSMEEQKPNPDPNGMPKVLPGKNRIPDKYSNFSSSGLSYEIKDGEQTIDVKLAD